MPRLLSLFLPALFIFAAEGHAQQKTSPAATTPNDPTKKAPPAEIMPPKPEMRPPAGQKPVEPVSPPALSPGSTGPASPAAEDALSTLIGTLPEAELEQILTVLKQRFVSPAALGEPELKRATVQGVLERLGSAVSLRATSAAPPEPSPLRTEAIGDRAGYLRLGASSRQTLTELDQALDSYREKKLDACILDLRATTFGYDFELAAEVCRRFCPKGQVLFTVRRKEAGQEQIYTAKVDPKFRGLLIVLTAGQTAGSGEVIAGVLRASAKAIVIGARTKGESAEFAETPLGGGHTLRFAVAEARIGGNESILGAGLEPDLPVQMAPEALAAVLKQELEKGVAPLLIEPERPRLNEAALVAGTNPELDAMQAAQRLRGERSKPILRDDMLLRALDLITSLPVLKR